MDLLNFVNGQWTCPPATEQLPVFDPATGQAFCRVPLSSAADVDATVQAGQRAFREWRNVPAGDRVQFLFRLKRVLEERLEDLARTITQECGKTLTESRGELRRGIENVRKRSGQRMQRTALIVKIKQAVMVIGVRIRDSRIG